MSLQLQALLFFAFPQETPTQKFYMNMTMIIIIDFDVTHQHIKEDVLSLNIHRYLASIVHNNTHSNNNKLKFLTTKLKPVGILI